MIQKLIAINTELYLPQIYVKYFNIYDRAKKYTQNTQYVFSHAIKNFFSFQMLLLSVLPYYSTKPNIF